MANNKKIIKRLYELRTYYLDKTDQINNIIDILNTTDYNETLERQIKEFIYGLFQESRTITQFDPGKKELYEMYQNIETSYSLDNKIDYNRETNTCKLIPFYLNREDTNYQILCKSASMRIINDFLKGEKLLKAIKKQATPFADRVKELKTTLNNSNLLPYYGDIDFLKGRIKYIRSSIDAVIQDDRIDPMTKAAFEEAYKNADKAFSIADTDFPSDLSAQEAYTEVENAYIYITSLENELAKYLEPIWKQYLTDPREYQAGEGYHFLLHSITGGYVKEDELTKVCATLGTEQCNPAYPSDIGYILDFDMDQINTMSYSDAFSFQCSKTEYIERGCPSSWQLAEKIGPNNYVYYEAPEISKLLLPWTMEEEIIKRQEQAANNPRPQNIYSEIFFYRNQKPIKITGYFAQTDRGIEMLQEINANGELPVIDFRKTLDKTK